MNTIDFIKLMAPIAMDDQRSTSVLASITIAQAILESASGNSASGNNLFGIKGQGQKLNTQEYVNGKWETVRDSFRIYNTWRDSVKDHSDFLLRNSRYTRSGFFERCKEFDYKGAAQALQNAGYATDPLYASKLIGLIEGHKLWEYDREAGKSMEELLKRTEILEAKVADLFNIVRVLEVTPPPQWFVNEFGADALAGIAHDPNGNLDFWRSAALSLRLKNKSNEGVDI